MRVEPEVIGTASGLGAFALALLVAFAHRKATFALVGADVRRLKQFSKRKPSSKGPTLILPPAFWRFTTYALMISLLGSDPRFDGLWTARASCDIPSNPSTETVRVTTFGYDFDGHLIQANYPEGIINYGYDLATGRHISICTTNSEVAYGFDPLGRLKTVAVLKRNGVTVTNEVITYAYTAVGSRSTQTLPNGIITTYL